MRVCEVLERLSDFDGKVVAIVGRFSFRADGRSLGEDSCPTAAKPWLKVSFDKPSAPRTPLKLEFDSALVLQLVREIQRKTTLAKFKFGTQDYDRWAVVYGRVEASRTPGAPPQLVCAGDSVVMFLVGRY